MGSPLKSAYLLRAKPVALIISYHTRGFVEEEKNGCSIGQPFIYKKYVMRGSSQVTTLIIPPTSISFILQAQPLTLLANQFIFGNYYTSPNTLPL